MIEHKPERAITNPPDHRLDQQPFFQLQGIVKSYSRTLPRVDVLKGVNLEINRGETYGLIGASGSGKTTLAKIAAGILKPDQGLGFLDGNLLARSPRDRRSQGLYKRIQFVFQDPYGTLNPSRTIEQNFLEPLLNGSIKKSHYLSSINRVVDQVGFPKTKLQGYPHELSGGLRQRVGLARALLMAPELLILDEPVASLDLSVQAKILNLLQELKKELNLTYFLISHDQDVIEYLSDTQGMLYKGIILSPKETSYEI
jgi:ABC-type dipeptide/oligopeptide/nickel transport system ATPase subunit